MTNDLIVAACFMCFGLGYWLADWLHKKLQARKDIAIAAKDTLIEALRERLASRELDQRKEVP